MDRNGVGFKDTGGHLGASEKGVYAGEGPLLAVAALGLTAIASAALFFYPQPFLKLSVMVGQSVGGG